MKRLTPQMIEVLMDCHEKELLDQEPCCGTSRTQNKKLLLTRGLLEAKMYTSKMTGKMFMAFFITDAGKQYLTHFINQ
jgi:hypothetical protein